MKELASGLKDVGAVWVCRNGLPLSRCVETAYEGIRRIWLRRSDKRRRSWSSNVCASRNASIKLLSAIIAPTHGLVTAIGVTAEGVVPKTTMPTAQQKRPPLFFDEVGIFYVRRFLLMLVDNEEFCPDSSSNERTSNLDQPR